MNRMRARAENMLGKLIPERASLFVKVIVPVLILFTLFSFVLGFWIAGLTRSAFLRQSAAQTEAQTKTLQHVAEQDWARFAEALANPVMHRQLVPLIQQGIIDHTSTVMENLSPLVGADFMHAYDAKGGYLTSSRATTSYREPAFLEELSRQVSGRPKGTWFLVNLPGDVLEFEKLGEFQPRGAGGQVLAVGTHTTLTDDFGDPVGMVMGFHILNGAQEYVAGLSKITGAGVSICHDGHVVATSVSDPEGKSILGVELCDIIGGAPVTGENRAVRAEIAGVSYTVGLLPVKDYRGNRVGTIALSNPIDAALRQASAIRWWIILAGLITLAGFAAVIALVIRRLFGSIHRVVDHMKAVAGGHLTGNLDIRTNDEMQLLGDAIDGTVVNLRELIGRVEGSFNMVEKVGTQLVELGDAVSEGGKQEEQVVRRLDDATGTLSSMMKTFAEGMASMKESADKNVSSLTELAASVEETARGADTLASSSGETSSAIQEMAASVGQVASSVASLNSFVTATSSAMEEIERAVKRIKGITDQTREVARGVAEEATEHGRTAMERANQGMQDLRRLVASLGDTVKLVDRKSAEISEIVALISEIADQTNLLALNASILAAQAGEEGKGFAVVAAEIRSLSEKTDGSIKQIEGHVRSIQKESRRAVEEVVKGVDAVGKGAEEVSQVQAVLDRIISGVGSARDMTEEISSQTEAQSRESSRVTKSLMEIGTMSAELAKATGQQADTARYISKLAEEMGTKAANMKRATGEQHQAVKYLSREAEGSSALAERVDRGSGEAAAGVSSVRDSMAVIRQVVEENKARVGALRESVQLLKDQSDKVRTHISTFRLS